LIIWYFINWEVGSGLGRDIGREIGRDLGTDLGNHIAVNATPGQFMLYASGTEARYVSTSHG
jgi:hypothetical protein